MSILYAALYALVIISDSGHTWGTGSVIAVLNKQEDCEAQRLRVLNEVLGGERNAHNVLCIWTDYAP